MAAVAVGSHGVSAKPTTDPPPPDAASATDLARTRRAIAERVDSAGVHQLTKRELRPALKIAMRRVQSCYERAVSTDAKLSGVVNTKLTIRNDPALGLSLTVTGFETDGALGDSKEFLSCMKNTLEANVEPPLPVLGRLDTLYPMTFDPGGRPHSDDASIVADCLREAKRGHCAEAIDDAERALKRSWLAGDLRHRLIEAAGTCACRLKDETKARRYVSLAPPDFADHIVGACASVGIQITD